MDRIAVLIPCYNEEQTVFKVVSDFKKALPDAAIYVYNNNSSDRTVEEAKRAGAIVRNEYQQGKGEVIRRMFREIEAECYLMVDGDDTYEASDAPKLCDEVLSHQADMVVGDRLSSTYFTENKRQFHNFGNSLVRFSINHIFHSDIKDIMTGYRAFSYDFVKTFPILSRGFEIETEMTIHAIDKRMNVRNVVIGYRDRPEGSESKLNTISDGLSVLLTIGRLFLYNRPLEFFSIVAGLLTVIAVGFFIPVFIDYLDTGLVKKFPTLIVCSFTMIAALLSFFAGVILSVIRNQALQDFELNRTSVHARFVDLVKSQTAAHKK